MAFASVVVENAIICLAAPIGMRHAVTATTDWLQDRPMFSIQVCYLLASSSGVILGLILLGYGGILERASISEIWKVNGLWHQARAYEMFFINLNIIVTSLQNVQATALNLSLFALLSAGMLFNTAVAILGWRSLAALRGIAAHCLVVFYFCASTLFTVLLFLWVLHWLNFWAFLILFLVIEIRRREQSGTRLSF